MAHKLNTQIQRPEHRQFDTEDLSGGAEDGEPEGAGGVDGRAGVPRPVVVLSVVEQEAVHLNPPDDVDGVCKIEGLVVDRAAGLDEHLDGPAEARGAVDKLPRDERVGLGRGQATRERLEEGVGDADVRSGTVAARVDDLGVDLFADALAGLVVALQADALSARESHVEHGATHADVRARKVAAHVAHATAKGHGAKAGDRLRGVRRRRHSAEFEAQGVALGAQVALGQAGGLGGSHGAAQDLRVGGEGRGRWPVCAPNM